MKRYSLAVLFLLSLSACWTIEKGEEFSHLAPGPWRAVFVFDESRRVEDKVPVLLEIEAKETGMPRFVFNDGQGAWESDSVRWAYDSLWVYFPEQGKYLRLKHDIALIQGWLEDERGEDYPLAFYAHHGQNYRFKEVGRKAQEGIAGRWTLELEARDSSLNRSVELELSEGKGEWKAILYWEGKAMPMLGTIQGQQLYFSGFDGRELLFLKAKLNEQGLLSPLLLRKTWQMYSGEGRK